MSNTAMAKCFAKDFKDILSQHGDHAGEFLADYNIDLCKVMRRSNLKAKCNILDCDILQSREMVSNPEGCPESLDGILKVVLGSLAATHSDHVFNMPPNSSIKESVENNIQNIQARIEDEQVISMAMYQ